MCTAGSELIHLRSQVDSLNVDTVDIEIKCTVWMINQLHFITGKVTERTVSPEHQIRVTNLN